MEKIAIVHFVNSPKGQSRSGMAAVMRYAAQEQKTLWQGQSLVSGVNCQAKSAYDDFLSTKLLHHKESGRLYYHLVQSFPKEALVDPVTAHQAAVRLAGFFQDREVLVCTHVDREHIHSHLIINSVSMEEGRKLHVSQNELEKLRCQNDLICKELNLPMFEESEHTRSSALSGGEYHAAARGESWKFQLMNAIDRCMTRAATRQEFLSLMKALGYQVRWSDSRTSITYTTPQGKKCRDNRLHEPKYLKGAMELEFTIRAAILTGRTQRAKFPSAEEPASGESDIEYSSAAHCDSVLSAQRDGADSSEPSQSGAECGTTDRTAESSLGSDPLLRDFLSAVHHQSDVDGNGQISTADSMDGTTGWEPEREAFLSSLTDVPASGMEPGLRSDSDIGGSLAGDLVHLGRSLEMTQQSNADTPSGHPHTDRKLRKKQREKKKALGHAEDEQESFSPTQQLS